MLRLPGSLGVLRTKALTCRIHFVYATVRPFSNKPADDSVATTGEVEGEVAKRDPVITVEELAALRAKFEAKDKEAAQFKERYQRALADSKNLQRTTKEEIEKARTYALQKFAKDLIATVDNFDLAMKAADKTDFEAEKNKEFSEFYKGVQMVQQVLEKTLEQHGVQKMNPVGDKYDPNFHEAIFQTPQPGKEPGIIFHVDRTGFKLHDRVLRAPKVGIVAEEQ